MTETSHTPIKLISYFSLDPKVSSIYHTDDVMFDLTCIGLATLFWEILKDWKWCLGRKGFMEGRGRPQ